MKSIKLAFVLFAIAFSTLIQAQIAPVDDNGLAIGGYDVVAYFSGAAQVGSATHAAEYNGVTYHFTSKENLAAFETAPTNYLPQFDGYCAWGVGAKETKFPINPETFDIIDGKLYLFFNGPFDGKTFNTLLPWNAETTELRDAAHRNWVKVSRS
ncbi:MAG: YHS domain-containing (seleno)protein [Saprospiraceae bacterium]